MSTYKSLGELTCLIIQPLNLGSVNVSEVRFYEAGNTNRIYTTTSTSVSVPYYGTWYFYLTDGSKSSAPIEVVYSEAKKYDMLTLEYFSATITVTTEASTSVTITGPNSYSETASTGTGTSVTFTVPAKGDYSVKATKNSVYSNTVSVTISTQGQSATATCNFCKLSITVDSGSSVTVTNSSGTTVSTYTQGSSAQIIYLSATGTYTVSASLSGQTTSGSVNCSGYTKYSIQLAYRALSSSMITTITNAESAGNLNSVAWSSIAEIATAIASDNATADDITEAKKWLGLSKSFTYSGSTCYAFVIGVKQDYNGSTPLGFTFWCVGSSTPFSTSSKALHITTSAQRTSNTNTGGWGYATNNTIRTALQSGGTIYANMPSEMTAVMKSKTTYYGPTYSSTSTSVSSVTDIMFILSEKELYNINNASTLSSSYDRPFWQYEGTGASHNEQYQLFANEGITSSSYSKLTCSTYCWLRTCSYNDSSSYSFMIVYTSGDPNSSSIASYSTGVAPAFCV